MASFVKVPTPRQLNQKETLDSLNHWKTIFRNYLFVWRNPICVLPICSRYAEKGLASLQSADIMYIFIQFSNICQTPLQAKLHGPKVDFIFHLSD